MKSFPGSSAARLGSRLQSGEITSVELTRSCLERIDRLDGALHAFLRINEDAEREADDADRRLREGRSEPLTGIPIAVKDNIATAGITTTCGARILERFVPSRDATAVARLRQAGAVIVGKTNLDEFGMGSSTENSAYGPTRNPWNTGRVPGGSSGGSAAAVAARMAPLALGTDTGGSVRQPAAFCGVVGLKPTYGRVSRSGLVAFGSSLDQIGPLTTTVEDAALVLECIAGEDPDDMTSRPGEPGPYRAACGLGVDGLRVGLPTEYFDPGLDPEIDAAVREAASELERRGARVEEVSLPHSRYAIPAYYVASSAEASSNLARYDGVRFGERAGNDGGLDAMYRETRGRGLGDEVKRRIMLGTYALSSGYYEAFYRRAQQVRGVLRLDFARLFETGFDLLLSPTTPTTAFPLGDKLDDPLAMYLSDIYTVTVSLAGLPALALPVARSGAGLPIGAQLIGPEDGEPTLFRAGACLERRFPMDAPPIAPADDADSPMPA